jgi:hypothetical protein
MVIVREYFMSLNPIFLDTILSRTFCLRCSNGLCGNHRYLLYPTTIRFVLLKNQHIYYNICTIKTFLHKSKHLLENYFIN